MDLKKDLDEYLLLQSDQKKSFKLTLPKLQKPNWFDDEETPDVPTTWCERTQRSCREGCCPTLTRMQRMGCFGFCLCMGILCFSLSLMYIPVLLFKARKFSLLFTLGSVFVILSLSFLWGPIAFLKYMFSRERVLLSLAYGGTLFATLYCAMHLQSTPLTVLFAIGQVISLLWTVLANIPGGTSGISFFGKMFSRSVNQTLPI